MGTDFAGRTALITGAGRGIGRAVAVGLADAGAGLILVARSAVELAQTQAIVSGRGASAGQVRIVPADLADQQQRDQAAAVALEAGGVDILVNNAATVEPLGPTAAVPVAALRRAFELNVIAPAALTAAVLPGMLEAGLLATVNSDDPAYFGGYVDDNLDAVRTAFGYGDAELAALARNSFEACFAPEVDKRAWQAEVDAWLAALTPAKLARRNVGALG